LTERKRPPTEAAFDLLTVDADDVRGISMLVLHFQSPFLTRLEPAIHIPEQFLAFGIEARIHRGRKKNLRIRKNAGLKIMFPREVGS
jgi:hypothetical protein